MRAREYCKENRQNHLEGLKKFLRIPSISSLKEHKADVVAAANFVADELRAIGLTDVAVVEGKQDGERSEHPLVIGQWMGAPGKPTVLLYAHYDVQPVDPLNKWTSPPFEPTERDGKLYARGSSDDKGQLWILLKALESYMKSEGKLPVNVKVLFEGEEEYTGAHIERFVEERPAFLNGVTSALVLDTGMFAPGLPTISTGLRGIITSDLIVRGASRDLHSGEFGGAAPNPLQALAEIIAALKTPSGRVRIPGFYDAVQKPSPLEKKSWAKLPFRQEEFRKEMGAPGLIGDRRYPVLHRLWALPTLEINGVTGGFSGDGFKTVIPSVASAKISMRLVPGMNPDEVVDLFRQYVLVVSPSHVQTEVRIIDSAPAMVMDPSDKAIQAAAHAFKEIFGSETAYIRCGGSIPIAGSFKSVLGVPVLITGFTLPDCNMHAPDENIVLHNFYMGIEGICLYLEKLGEM